MSATSQIKEQQMELLSVDILNEQHVQLLPARNLMQSGGLGGLLEGINLIGGLLGR
jgi:hypothetical protein